MKMIDINDLDEDILDTTEDTDIFLKTDDTTSTDIDLEDPFPTFSASMGTQQNKNILFPHSSASGDWESSSNYGSKNLSLEDRKIPEPEKLELPDSDNNIAFGSSGYAQSEIDSHISKAEHDMRAAESNMRHHSSIAASKERMGEPHSFEDSQYNNAKRAYNDAKAELRKWENTKPAKD